MRALFWIFGGLNLANGLWTAAITWGLTISARAQQRWGVVCAALGIALMGMGWSAVIGYATLDPDTARQVEASINGGHAQATPAENPPPSTP